MLVFLYLLSAICVCVLCYVMLRLKCNTKLELCVLVSLFFYICLFNVCLYRPLMHVVDLTRVSYHRDGWVGRSLLLNCLSIKHVRVCVCNLINLNKFHTKKKHLPYHFITARISTPFIFTTVIAIYIHDKKQNTHVLSQPVRP